MKILYVGDVMGRAGRNTIAKMLPNVIAEFTPDFVIAQAENSDDSGKGPGPDELKQLVDAGVNFFSGGNHSLLGPGSEAVYENKTQPIVRPANLQNTIGDGFRVVETAHGPIAIVSLLGQTVGARQPELDNPLETIDTILNTLSMQQVRVVIVNFHGDFSSEKRVIGYYLDGRASAVIGDHWHVPTADAMVLPGGTAHITDVGMCGALHSSLGVKTDVIIRRWQTGQVSRNEMEQSGPMQFNAVMVQIDPETGRATDIQHIHRVIE